MSPFSSFCSSQLTRLREQESVFDRLSAYSYSSQYFARFEKTDNSRR